jgi:hypothetical protein
MEPWQQNIVLYLEFDPGTRTVRSSIELERSGLLIILNSTNVININIIVSM